MDQRKKIVATSFLVLTIVIVIFLASGISEVELQPGTINLPESRETNLAPPQLPKQISPIWTYLLIFGIWVIMPIWVILLIKYPEIRKRTIKSLFYIAMYGLILFLLGRKTQEETPELEKLEEELIDSTILETQHRVGDFITTATDNNFNFILDITIFILVGLLVWYIYSRFYRQKPSTSAQLKIEIQEAINEIESGVDFRNVIIRCYADMSQILKEKRDIERQKAMTPREFESELEDIGLPSNAIKRLTNLFEEVRYGYVHLGSDAEQEALQCLTAIAEAC